MQLEIRETHYDSYKSVENLFDNSYSIITLHTKNLRDK